MTKLFSNYKRAAIDFASAHAYSPGQDNNDCAGRPAWIFHLVLG